MDEDAPSEHTGDLDALFAEVNNLPPDDPLRNQSNGQQAVPDAANELASAAAAGRGGEARAASPGPSSRGQTRGSRSAFAGKRRNQRAASYRSWRGGQCRDSG